ncbi:hypothetical protein JCM12141A_57850 [Mycolicibacterium hodleri]
MAFTVGEATDVAREVAATDAVAAVSLIVTPVCIEPALRGFELPTSAPFACKARAPMATTAKPPTPAAA